MLKKNIPKKYTKKKFKLFIIDFADFFLHQLRNKNLDKIDF